MGKEKAMSLTRDDLISHLIKLKGQHGPSTAPYERGCIAIYDYVIKYLKENEIVELKPAHALLRDIEKHINARHDIPVGDKEAWGEWFDKLEAFSSHIYGLLQER